MQSRFSPIASVAVLSASALAYEVLLIRIFSIIQWHHFAYMIISLALLGYGASGTFLALLRKHWIDRCPDYFIANILAFTITSIFCFMAAERIVINPDEMLWDLRQLLRLPAVYVLLGLPFFFAANAIGLVLGMPDAQTARIYAADLTGAGAGCLAVVGMLYILHPATAMQAASIAGVAAAVLAWRLLRIQADFRFAAILATALLVLLVPQGWKQLVVSQYKGLPQLLLIPGTRIADERSSALGLITVVESRAVPLRYAPGLSLNAASGPPPQLAVFTDAGAMTAITRFSGNLNDLRYLDQMTSALPYHLKSVRNALVLCAGGGSDVLQARYHNVDTIDAVELNPQVVALAQKRYGSFAGYVYQHPGTRVHIGDARGFARTNRDAFDLIQLTVPGSFEASTAGLYSLNEDYLFTVEAMEDYLGRLSPDGLLGITSWIKMPPRDTFKLFATAVEAMKRNGVTDPERRLILIRSWQTSTLLVKNGLISSAEIVGLTGFCAERSFDAAYYPGMKREDADRFNHLEQPSLFYDSAVALLGPGSRDFIQAYKFNIKPSTDDRPYFFHFFKWRILPEIFTHYGRRGISLLETGYLILVFAFLQALLCSCALILLPLWIGRRSSAMPPPGRIFVYFLSLGLAFFFIEIAFIQKFVLLLQQPVLSIAVSLTAFLLFAGIGSYFSQRLSARLGSQPTLLLAVTLIVVIGVIYLLALDTAVKASGAMPVAVRIAVTIGLIAPLALFMGMPFPQGLAALHDRREGWIPWAWAINGCASVLSTILATMLAIQFGFTVVILAALALYIFAALTFPTPLKPLSSSEVTYDGTVIQKE